MSKQEALSWVRAHGREAVSFQALTCASHHWFSDAGCVAYVESGSAWIAVGGPLAEPARSQEVAQEFVRAAARAGKRARFFATERACPSDGPLISLQVGEQPIWDPAEWPGRLSRKLERQIRQHRQRGRVRVYLASASELADASAPVRRGIDAVAARWLAGRKMAPMGFLVRLNLYEQASERRYFVAEHAGKVVCVLIALPVYAQNGWLLETCLRDPEAPGGAMELTFDHALRSFAAERCTYVSYGLCPLTGSNSLWQGLLRRSARSLYDFDGLRRFKGKLQPTRWQPVYLTYPRHELAPLALLDVLSAFCPEGILAFSHQTLRRRTLSPVLSEPRTALGHAT